MIEPRLFVCSGAKVRKNDSIAKGRDWIELDAIGDKANVNIRFENVAEVLKHHIHPRLVDLLEVASYVFTADCATNRGEEWTDHHATEPWGRDLGFVIPVRDLEFWRAEKTQSLLTTLLNFISNDRYLFQFVPLKRERPKQEYFEFVEQDWSFNNPERVVMFSGGLDSLAGAVETARSGSKVVLVSHRPVSTLGSRQRRLFDQLCVTFPNQLIHIPVWINKAERFNQEPTQRTRSFLFSALGTVVAQSIRAGGVRFFENGVVSLNLPVANEVLRARASRTTHPVAMQLLQLFCSAVTDRDFIVDNPYIFRTKTEVVASIATNHAEHLISQTCSCAHLMFKSKNQWHCGTCSQCIDRRFGLIGAGLSSYDLETDYVSDVFIGPRKSGPEKNMAVDYIRHGIELSERTEAELAAIFNAELTRAVRYEDKRSDAAEKLIAMHKRHGKTVKRVLEEMIAAHASTLLDGAIEATSLLGLILGRKHIENREPLRIHKRGTPTAANLAPTTASDLDGSSDDIRVLLKTILSKIRGKQSSNVRSKPRLSKREIVIFAAILNELKGLNYCQFLQDHAIKPRWPDIPGAATYPRCHLLGGKWAKKVQDEKTRIRVRMDQCPQADLANALIIHLPSEFNSLSALLHSRNSRHTS